MNPAGTATKFQRGESFTRGWRLKVLTDDDIVFFFLSRCLPNDPKEAERLLLRIKEVVDRALIGVWNGE